MTLFNLVFMKLLIPLSSLANPTNPKLTKVVTQKAADHDFSEAMSCTPLRCGKNSWKPIKAVHIVAAWKSIPASTSLETRPLPSPKGWIVTKKKCDNNARITGCSAASFLEFKKLYIPSIMESMFS